MSGENEKIEQIARNAVLQGLFGQSGNPFNIDKLSMLAAGISSSEYAVTHMQGARRCTDNLAFLSFALSQASLGGLFLEFGVASGRTINHLAQIKPEATFYGFDSFEGLPEDWRPGYGKGAFAQQPPEVSPNVNLLVGYFDLTLPGFCAERHSEVVAFLHVDCDLYSSTQTIFRQLRGKIVPGTIIAFDEYFNYPGWQQHEFSAFQEFCRATQTSYRYIAVVPSHQQVAVRILG